MLIHPSPDSQDRKGNLVSRQRIDCLHMVKKVAALPMRPESTGHKSTNQWWSFEKRAPANYKESPLGSILCSAPHRFCSMCTQGVWLLLQRISHYIP